MGGAAYGIPRNTRTPVDKSRPFTGPYLVCMGSELAASSGDMNSSRHTPDAVIRLILPGPLAAISTNGLPFLQASQPSHGGSAYSGEAPPVRRCIMLRYHQLSARPHRGVPIAWPVHDSR